MSWTHHYNHIHTIGLLPPLVCFTDIIMVNVPPVYMGVTIHRCVDYHNTKMPRYALQYKTAYRDTDYFLGSHKISSKYTISPNLIIQDRAYELKQDHHRNNRGRRPSPTGRYKKRLCLVLDCLAAHEFSSKTCDLINLQHYVIREKKLTEKEAIIMFSDVVRIVDSLHKVSITFSYFDLQGLKFTRIVSCTWYK